MTPSAPWAPSQPVLGGILGSVKLAQTIPQRRAILTAVDALLNFGGADAIADTLPRIELARKLLKEID